MSNKNNVKKLIESHNRRLQELQQKEALLGIGADPSIALEIENIEAKLKELEAHLETHSSQKSHDYQRNVQLLQREVTFKLASFLEDQIDESRYHYPYSISIDQILKELHQKTGLSDAEINAYIRGIFDLLRVIGCLDYEGIEKIVLRNGVSAATLRAFCLAIHEGIPELFNYKKRAAAKHINSGNWFLHRLEEKRRLFNPDNRAPSRTCEFVVILVKAMLAGEPAILFQRDRSRSKTGLYKFIGGRVDPVDADWSKAAIRELEEEVQDDTGIPPSNIEVGQLSQETYEYMNISERIGAYTRYRVHVFDCRLELPPGCYKEEFEGENHRLSKWFPLKKVSLDNENVAQKEVLGHILMNGWLNKARLSTSEPIE